MLSGELASRTRKLEREQAQRLEKLRAREEKERLVAQRQAQREQAREEEIRQRRLVQEAAREAVRNSCVMHECISLQVESSLLLPSNAATARPSHPCTRFPTTKLSWQEMSGTFCNQVLGSSVQERLRHEEDLEVNNGVWWQASLSVVPADDSAASSKGIKRALDKARRCTGSARFVGYFVARRTRPKMVFLAAPQGRIRVVVQL